MLLHRVNQSIALSVANHASAVQTPEDASRMEISTYSQNTGDFLSPDP